MCVDIQLLNMGIRNKVYHCRGAILYDFYLAKSGLPPAKARIPPGKHEISLATNSSTQTQNLSQFFWRKVVFQARVCQDLSFDGYVPTGSGGRYPTHPSVPAVFFGREIGQADHSKTERHVTEIRKKLTSGKKHVING